MLEKRPNCLTLSPLHGLRTPNEGMNQRNLKIWANVADKMCFGRNYKFGIELLECSESYFISGCPVRGPLYYM